MPRHLFLILLAVSCLCRSLSTAHAASYTFTTLDVPGARATQAFEINDSGQIVGWFSDGTRNHGFLTDGATFTPIDVPGAMHTFAFGINTAGQIVGGFSDGTTSHGFLTDGATFTPIDVPGASQTQAFGINDSGQIVGEFTDATGVHGFVATPQVTVVTIDIKPGSDPATINPKSQGVIPVAILTTDTFDATTVNASTVRFGKNGTEAPPVQSAVEDVNGDGLSDLILHFNTQATGIQCGDTSASLTGQTFSGRAIQGSDSIVTVGCR
jgi:probable HAF family extracellular repeat protein